MQRSSGLKEKRSGFIALLSAIDINTITGEQYCKKYLSYLLAHKEYFTDIYADVLDKLVIHSKKSKEQIILVDYGAGNGLLGIFAKYCGFKKVYLNDIDQDFLDASKKLALQLNIQMNGYLHGDSGILPAYFIDEKPDGIIGTDVIEHIYDLEVFFATLCKLNPAIVTVFTTASNPDNFIKVKKLKKLQWKDEHFGSAPGDSELSGSHAHEAYVKMREDIIRNNFDLPEDKILSLARSTRGLKKDDILTSVHKSIQIGENPQNLIHPTNTCNPLTGSWTERILTINEYRNIYKNAGFQLSLYAGFYDTHSRKGKRAINFLLNTVTNFFGRTTAPYIILAGNKA